MITQEASVFSGISGQGPSLSPSGRGSAVTNVISRFTSCSLVDFMNQTYWGFGAIGL